MFDSKDKKNLGNLMELILNNIKLNDLDCMDISKAYHSFEWLQSLEGKLDDAMAMQLDLEDMSSTIQKREDQLMVHIESLEGEIKELKKPKRKTTKKRK